MKKKTICFTGHREIRQKDAGKIEILKEILEHFIREGYLYFAAGGARGFDMLAAETVLEFQKTYRDIELILVLPFDKPYMVEKGWSESEIKRYEVIKKAATEIIYIGEKYKRGCYYKRNRMLVSLASMCIAYKYKESGGTAYTVAEAEKENIGVLNIVEIKEELEA